MQFCLLVEYCPVGKTEAGESPNATLLPGLAPVLANVSRLFLNFWPLS